MSKTYADLELNKARQDLAEYYHPHCGTTTKVTDSAIKWMVMDPFFYDDDETDCDRCGLAPTSDCVLKMGTSVRHWVKRSRKRVSSFARFMRNVGLPALFGLLIALFTLPISLAMKADVQQITVAFFVCWVLIGMGAARIVPGYLFMLARSRGYFWDK